jgi:hypothetical protein
MPAAAPTPPAVACADTAALFTPNAATKVACDAISAPVDPC